SGGSIIPTSLTSSTTTPTPSRSTTNGGGTVECINGNWNSDQTTCNCDAGWVTSSGDSSLCGTHSGGTSSSGWSYETQSPDATNPTTMTTTSSMPTTIIYIIIGVCGSVLCCCCSIVCICGGVCIRKRRLKNAKKKKELKKKKRRERRRRYHDEDESESEEEVSEIDFEHQRRKPRIHAQENETMAGSTARRMMEMLLYGDVEQEEATDTNAKDIETLYKSRRKQQKTQLLKEYEKLQQLKTPKKVDRHRLEVARNIETSRMNKIRRVKREEKNRHTESP
ncbi:hypothetical protein AKO1_015423, partial [Acrasis kona]